jgi:thymidylate kinase
MLVAFEGQDGAGKTALLEAVHAELQARRIASVIVDEFSDSPHGQRLIDAVARDKFLRPVSGEQSTYFTRALEEVADLYYLDERVIGPACERSMIVLKDRHRDTILYTLAPMLLSAGAITSQERALTWLSVLMSELRYRPAFTVYVAAPLPVRLARIAERTRHLVEDRANEVSEDDRAVFAARDRIMQQLLDDEPERFLVINNSDRPIAKGAREIVAAITERLTDSSAKGVS